MRFKGGLMMNIFWKSGVWGVAAFVLLSGEVSFGASDAAPGVTLTPGNMQRVGSVDERFQSYNIEMVEVTGGRFWKPYDSTAEKSLAGSAASSHGTPAGMDPSLFEYRKPIDLSNARLRKLAAALGPAYVRVSGTWQNTTFFDDSDTPAPAAAPAGFNSVLTRGEWKGVVDFANAVRAKIVTSLSISPGTRNAEGVWTPAQAKAFFSYTKQVGGEIAAAEFMNEPTIAEMGGAPNGYDAKAYARDFAVFRKFAKENAPGMVILGPGGVGEGSGLMASSSMHVVKSEDIMAATGPNFDAVSYHSYGGVSSRCGNMGATSGTTADAALSEEWLSRGEKIEAFYGGLRDRFEPGKPLWLTETAQTACGGDRWASTFVDSFRYLNQLGGLARRGVQVHLHNTLAASDYALLDEKTYEPRPNYWAALLWHRLMGTTVLDAGASPSPNLHIYAHCMRDKPGGVVVLAINADKTVSQLVETPIGVDRYTLTAKDLLGKTVEFNGRELSLGEGDVLPPMTGVRERTRHLNVVPESISFFAFPLAHNASCQ
jgi:heparanase 1